MGFRLLPALRDATWLNRDRIVAWGSLLLMLELAFLIFIALWQHGMVVETTAAMSSDFVSFYAAGTLALTGTPALAYDQAAHYLAQQAATISGAPYQFFFYPPVFILLCAGLAKLPYMVAFGTFELATMALFLVAMRGVLRERGFRWVIPVMAFAAVFWTIGLGQNAFLTAALFAGFTLMIDKRPIAAGILLGLLCYKPHFGLLLPFALAASGRWQAFAAAAATVAALAGVSVVLFGVATWQAYLTAFLGSQAVYGSGRIDYAGMVTPFGAVRLLGYTNEQASMLQATMALLMIGVVGLVWRLQQVAAARNAGMHHAGLLGNGVYASSGSGPSETGFAPGSNLSVALLPVATLLAVPLALVYDQLLLLVAMAWLIRDARECGFLSWERIALAAVFPVSLLTWIVGTAWHVPLGPLASLAVMALILRRVRHALNAHRRSGSHRASDQRPVDQRQVDQRQVEHCPVEQCPKEQCQVEQRPVEQRPVEQRLVEAHAAEDWIAATRTTAPATAVPEIAATAMPEITVPGAHHRARRVAC